MEKALLSISGTNVGSMVGINVGGTYSGHSVCVIVGEGVVLGKGVTDAVTVADGTGDAVGAIDCPQATKSMLIPIKILALRNVFISPTHFIRC
jgi:hypothetical protein